MLRQKNITYTKVFIIYEGHATTHAGRYLLALHASAAGLDWDCWMSLCCSHCEGDWDPCREQ